MALPTITLEDMAFTFDQLLDYTHIETLYILNDCFENIFKNNDYYPSDWLNKL